MLRFCSLTLLLLLAGVATSAAQQPLPAGDEFTVNSFTTGNQGFPNAAMDSEGNFVVVWESDGPDGDYFGVVAQRYSPRGTPLGTEFQVNTYTSGPQWDPKVDLGPSGEATIVWASFEVDASGFGIAGQRLDAAGAPVGSEFVVNASTDGDQINPDVAIGADGGFLVVWEGAGLDTSFGGISGQLYDDQGMALGSDFLINATTAEEQNDPRVASGPDGYIVVWESIGIDAEGEAVMMQRLDTNGSFVGAEERVNTSQSSDQEDPGIAILDDGRFAVVWESDGQDGDDETAVAQVFDATGVRVGGELVLNSTTLGAQDDPEISAIDGDSFVAVWEGPSPMDTDDLWGRRVDASGQLLGDEFEINIDQTANDQDKLTIAGHHQGRIVTAWRSFGGFDGDQAGVFGQIFDLALFADGFESGMTTAWTSTP